MANFKQKDIVRGTTRAVSTTFLQSDGTPYDLSGGTVRYVATTVTAPSDDTGAAIDVFTTTHPDPLNGISQIILTSHDTDIEPGTYNAGIQATLADGTVVEKTGTVKITQDFVKTTP